MNHSFPRLTLGLIAFLSLCVAAPMATGQGSATAGPASATASPTSSAIAQPADQNSPGNRFIAESARRVQEEPALAADLRYRIDAFGHELVGLGTYRQLGRGPEKLLRMEVKIQVADQVVSRQEICSQQYYWVRRESPLAPASLGRVNLRQVRQAATRGPEMLATNTAEVWMLLGGLPRLLESLHQNFDFAAPVEDELQFTGADGQTIERMPVLVVRGRWKPKALATILETNKQPSSLPEQLPDAVDLVLGRPEQVLPLFPYRVTYLKAPKSAKGQGGGGESLKPLLTMELFNVSRKGDLDPREFEYNPGEQEVADLTPSYLQRLGLAPKTR